ncbi:unnamed protein product, partial [Prorocentrum cordatum]
QHVRSDVAEDPATMWVGTWPGVVLSASRQAFQDSAEGKYEVLLKETTVNLPLDVKAYKLQFPSEAQAFQFQAAFNSNAHKWLRSKSFAKIYPGADVELQNSLLWTAKHQFGANGGMGVLYVFGDTDIDELVLCEHSGLDDERFLPHKKALEVLGISAQKIGENIWHASLWLGVDRFSVSLPVIPGFDLPPPAVSAR